MKIETCHIVSALRDKLHEGFEEDHWRITVHDALAAVLNRWKGKKLTKRFATQFAEKLCPDPAARVKLCWFWSRAGQFEVWGIGPWPTYDKRGWFYIGPHVSNYPGDFEESDVANGAVAKKRNCSRLFLLQTQEGITALLDLAEKIHKLIELKNEVNQLIDCDLNHLSLLNSDVQTYIKRAFQAFQ